jgi:hypothetical protein
MVNVACVRKRFTGMLNAVGLQNVGVRAFVAEYLPKLRPYKTAVVANVFGKTVQEYVQQTGSWEWNTRVCSFSFPSCTDGGSNFDLSEGQPGLAGRVNVWATTGGAPNRVEALYFGQPGGTTPVDLGPCSTTIDLGDARARDDVGTDIGELDEDDVAQAVLREVGDPDRGARTLDAHPLVLRAVPKFLGDVHGEGDYVSLSLRGRAGTCDPSRTHLVVRGAACPAR